MQKKEDDDTTTKQRQAIKQRKGSAPRAARFHLNTPYAFGIGGEARPPLIIPKKVGTTVCSGSGMRLARPSFVLRQLLFPRKIQSMFNLSVKNARRRLGTTAAFAYYRASR